MPITNFPKAGGDKKVSLRNSQYDRFPLDYAEKLRVEHPAIWKAGGNIEGNRSYRLLKDHIQNGTMSPTIEDKIREREAWMARHEKDGDQFVGSDKSPNLSNIGGIVALIKWVGINPKLGVSGMKRIINEVIAKQERSIKVDQDKELDKALEPNKQEERNLDMTDKVEEIKEEPKVEEPKVEEVKEEPKVEEVKEEPKTEEVKEETKVEEVKEEPKDVGDRIEEEVKEITEEVKAEDRSKKSEKFFRSAFIKQRNINDSSRSVEFSFMSDQPVEREFGIESIDVSKTDMSFIGSGNAPLLLDHDTKSQIGVIEKAEIVNGKGRAVARFGKSQLASEVFEDVKEGIRKNISVGYVIKEMDKIMDEEMDNGDGTPYFKVGIQPLEISLVSVPADTSVGIGRSLTTKQKVTIMENKEAKKVAEEVVNKDQIQKNEVARIREIEAIAKKHNLQDLADVSVRSGHSVAEFKGLVLDKIGTSKPLEANPAEVGLNSKEQKRYSMLNAIRASLTNDWSKAGFEKEVNQEIEKRSGRSARGFFVPSEIFKRDLTQGTATAGGHVTPDVHRGDLFIDALRDSSIVTQAGATVFTGLKGDIKIPRLTTKGTVGFVAENSAVSETNQAFDQVTMTERTVGGFVDISRVLMNNANPSIEQIVRNDMTQQIALKIDEVAFEGGGSNEPTGITQTSGIGDVAIGTNGGAITYAATIDLIKEIAQDNALKGSLGYAVTPEVVYQMRKTSKVSSTDSVMIMDNADVLNGYKVYQSSQLPKDLTKGTLSGTAHAMIFGNWQDLLIGYYSGLDVLVDPYTGSSAGTVRLNFFTGMDVAVRHAQSFAAILDIDETA